MQANEVSFTPPDGAERLQCQKRPFARLLRDGVSSRAPYRVGVVSKPVSKSTCVHDGMSTVLIADDHPSIRRLLRMTLDQCHTLIEAKDGVEALELLRRHRPAVAVLDVTMPGLTGLQVCRLIRADPDLRHTAIITISANANADAALQAGADRFIATPFRPTVLLDAVDHLSHAGACA
jgi:CheY-like chemotaxis protein